jgi:hypothetical protein
MGLWTLHEEDGRISRVRTPAASAFAAAATTPSHVLDEEKAT